MTIKNAKTILFVGLIAAMILSFSGMEFAHAEELTTEQEAFIDQIGEKIIQLQQNNIQYEKLSETTERADLVEDNLNKIDGLFKQLDFIVPVEPTVEISLELRKQMTDITYTLMESELPLLEIYIGSSTGLLTITVNQEKTVTGHSYDSDIQEIIGKDIPIEIRYGLDTAKFQGSCNTSTDKCTPIIGGSLGEDKTNGLDCTVSIAVVRDNWPWTDENGIIIPDHCNPNTSDYYQADKDVAGDKVGSQTKDGGWYCDCDFIKSDSRSINTAKINNNGNDISLTGNADIADEKWVTLYGFASGSDTGKIKEVNVSKQFDGNWFSDLYKIQYISYTDGDSGAPVIYNSKYGGMNIGEDVISGTTYNYAHDWTFLKYKLGLN